MSTYKRLSIKSRIKDYSVSFIDNLKDGFDPEPEKKYFLIIDQNVKNLYERELEGFLKKYPFLVIEATEERKTLDYVRVVIRQLIDSDVKRGYALVAIGGGIIQDITAFIASILYRGVDWVFYPTTLLSQSDSCIGSKTSINVDEYKNQVGNFYPPCSIFLNTNFLKTLSYADIRSGLGEIIKVHLLDGKWAMKYMQETYDRSLNDPTLMEELIFRSLRIKKRIIEKDEFDTGIRNIMNYGHTFGHALESITHYKLCHGQAITVGMDISNFLSCKFGYISEEMYSQMREILLKNWPDYDLKSLDLSQFFKSLAKDKKNTGSKITAILTEGPGRMKKSSFALDDKVRDTLSSYFKNL